MRTLLLGTFLFLILASLWWSWVRPAATQESYVDQDRGAEPSAIDSVPSSPPCPPPVDPEGVVDLASDRDNGRDEVAVTLENVFERVEPSKLVDVLAGLIDGLDLESQEDRERLVPIRRRLYAYTREHPEVLEDVRRVFRTGSPPAQYLMFSALAPAAARGQLQSVASDVLDVYLGSDSEPLRSKLVYNVGTLPDIETAIVVLDLELSRVDGNLDSMHRALIGFDTLLTTEARTRQRRASRADPRLVELYPSEEDVADSTGSLVELLEAKVARQRLPDEDLRHLLSWVARNAPDRLAGFADLVPRDQADVLSGFGVRLGR